MQPDAREPLSKESISQDLRGIFDILKNDPSATTVQKTALFTLLKHINLEENCKYFFVYLKARISQSKSRELTFPEFRELFINPTIDFGQMSVAEISELFIMFDERRKGSLRPQDILRIYRESEEYRALSPQAQREYEKQVESDFKMINSSGELAAEDFQNVLNFGKK